MRNPLRRALCLALALCMVLPLCACGGSGSKSAKTTLTMWCIATESDPNLQAYEQAIREYEEAHPEDNLEETDETGASYTPAPVKKSLAFKLSHI